MHTIKLYSTLCRYTFKDDHNQACVRKLISEVQAFNPSFEARNIRGMYMYVAQLKRIDYLY